MFQKLTASRFQSESGLSLGLRFLFVLWLFYFLLDSALLHLAPNIYDPEIPLVPTPVPDSISQGRLVLSLHQYSLLVFPGSLLMALCASIADLRGYLIYLRRKRH